MDADTVEEEVQNGSGTVVVAGSDTGHQARFPVNETVLHDLVSYETSNIALHINIECMVPCAARLTMLPIVMP